MPSLRIFEDRAGKIRAMESSIASDEVKIQVYRSELEALVEDLKQKHDYDVVSKSLKENRSGLAVLKNEQMRDAAFMVIEAVYGLLDADPARLGEFMGWLEQRWHVSEQHNSYAGGRDYVTYFGAFVSDVCRNERWAEEQYEILDDGGVRIEQRQRHLKEPCIALTLPADILSDPGPFLEDCRSFTETAAEEWAERYVEMNAGRSAKLDALRKALGKAV